MASSYKYDKDKLLIAEINEHPDGNTTTYYKYDKGLLIESKSGKFNFDMETESNYDFPKSEMFKNVKFGKTIYNYVFWDDLSYNNVKQVFDLKVKILDKLEFLENLKIREILYEKPQTYTDSQYV